VPAAFCLSISASRSRVFLFFDPLGLPGRRLGFASLAAGCGEAAPNVTKLR